MGWYEVDVVMQKTVIIEADNLEWAEAEACNIAFDEGGEPSSVVEITAKEAADNKHLVDVFISADN